MNRTSRPVRNEPNSRASSVALLGLAVGLAIGLLVSIFTPTGLGYEGVDPTQDPENHPDLQPGESQNIPYDPSI